MPDKKYKLIDTEDKVLSVGPWFGEFGYELFNYQAKIRSFLKDYNFGRVVVSCRQGRGFLYEDFADEIIEYRGVSENSVNAHTKSSIDHAVINKLHENFLRIKPDYNIEGGSWLWNGYDLLSEDIKNNKTVYINRDADKVYVDNKFHSDIERSSRPHYIKWGNVDGNHRYDFVIHARSIKKVPKKGYNLDILRNWEKEKWNELVLRLKTDRPRARIACVGSLDGAHTVENCEDLRGVDLSELADILFTSRLIVGPSSGPMHFATLCACPQVVWDNVDSRNRYINAWNPFGTEVYYYNNKVLENDPHKPKTFKHKTYVHSPPVNDIYNLVTKALNEKG